MEMEKATEIVLAQELFEQGLSKSAIARRLGRDRETIRRRSGCGCAAFKHRAWVVSSTVMGKVNDNHARHVRLML